MQVLWRWISSVAVAAGGLFVAASIGLDGQLADDLGPWLLLLIGFLAGFVGRGWIGPLGAIVGVVSMSWLYGGFTDIAHFLPFLLTAGSAIFVAGAIIGAGLRPTMGWLQRRKAGGGADDRR